jgi:hypothetical protein
VSCLHGDVAEYRRCLADFFAVGTPAHQDAFARWEFLVDGYMATHPLSALCGYGLELGNDAVAEYVDHRLLLTLDAYGRRNRIAVSLRSAPPFVARLMELLPVVSLQLAKSGAQE